MKGLRGWAAGLAVVLVLGGLAYGQSLAEAAKKEKERKSKLKTVKVRTFTNKDLQARKATTKEPAKGSRTVSTVGMRRPTSAATAATRAEQEAEKKAWLDEYRKLREKEYQLKQRIQKLEDEIRIMTMGYMASDFPDQTQILREEIANRRGLQQAAREELAQTQQAIRRLMREARRAGVRPGDFRAIDRELARKQRAASGKPGR